MIASWHIDELIALVRERYPGWENVAHGGFVADEIAYKREAAGRARELLGKGRLRELLAVADYDEILRRVEQVGHLTNMLWTAQPKRGDMALLYADDLNKWELVEQLRALLYDQRPSPDRLEAFASYCAAAGLPLTWPFPTYLLFLLRPQAEMFVKPTVARWFLKFMGLPDVYTSRPSAGMYERYKKNCHGLLADLREPYGVRDMIDLQSLIWVAYDVTQERTGRLDERGRVELDRPLPLREESGVYEVDPRPEDGEVGPPAAGPQPLSLAELADRLALPPETVQGWAAALARKGQGIFYGPPGTGKTHSARLLAQHLVGGGDGFVEFVQFHPAYDYADFVEGIRPAADREGRLIYENRPGIFLDFCRRAAERQDRCVLIVDEINRANLSRVFGELMVLLEYRDQTVTLASGRPLRIPANVHLLGTMNTADRSIALIDHALRRRFAFFHLWPNFELLRRRLPWPAGRTAKLISLLQQLNRAIGDPDYAVGHTFFLQADLDTQLPDVWQMEIEPYLEELFFNRREVLDRYRWDTIAAEISPTPPS